MLQTSSNGSCQLIRKGPTEKEWFISCIEFICAYIDDVLVFTKGECPDYIKIWEITISKLKVKGLKYNIDMSFFVQTEM